MIAPTYHRRLRQAIAFLFIVALVPAALLATPPRQVLAQEDLAEISAQIAAAGSARVLVSYDVPREPEATLSPAAVRSQRSRIAQAQDLVSRRLVGTASQEVRRLTTVPASAYTVDAAGLALLQADPLVSAIRIDGLSKPLMYNSNGVIGADDVWGYGYSGEGQVVAVLDTGVDKDHPFLSGQVVSEACYSTTDAGYGSTSLCPGGAPSSTAAGSGVDCDTAIDGCGHGTHVAGTIAGTPRTVTDGVNNYAISGVAPEAQIIAVQVFTEFPADTFVDAPFPEEDYYIDDSPCGADPCALSFSSDQMDALERVLELTATYDIAAVNMSLGGGVYSSSCDTTATDGWTPYTDLIEDLRDAGTAVVIASGNEYLTGAVGFPACISSAVTVGSTTNTPRTGYADPAVDQISGFSNVSSLVDLYAPGQMILSSTGGAYDWFAGTSMATPHVAGAFALLGSVAPDSTVAQRLSALKSTGKSITGRGYTIPRIRVERAALTMLPPTETAVSGSAGALELGWTSAISDSHSIMIDKLAVNGTAYTSLITLTGRIGGANVYTDTSAVPACSYRIAAKTADGLKTASAEIDNTSAPVSQLSFSGGRKGSTFTLYACGLPAETTAEISINGEAQTSGTTDAHGRLRLNLVSSASAAFGRYDVEVTVGSAEPLTVSYDIADTLTLRAAGAQTFFPAATTVNVSAAPITFDLMLPNITR